MKLFLTVIAWLSISFSSTLMAETSPDSQHNKILFVSAAHSNKAKVKLLKEVASTPPSEGTQLRFNVEQKSAKALKDIAKAETLFSEYDLVVLDAVSSRFAKQTFEAYLPTINKVAAEHSTKFIALNWLENQAAQKGLSPTQQQTLQTYWKNAGRKNLTNMLNFIAFDILQRKNTAKVKVAEPIVFPTQGIYHPAQPNLMSDSLTHYQNWSAPTTGQTKIALLMQRASIETEQTTVIDQTIKRLEAKGAYVVPFFFELSPRSGDYSHLLQSTLANGSKQTEIDLIINFRNIHWANKRKTEFEQFGVPVIQALTYYDGNQKHWEASKEGISSGMMSFMLVLPESAGVIDPTIVAAMNHRENKVEIIDYQLDFIIERALNYAKLANMPNADKKLTTLFWGDQDMGASFLNVPESLGSISHRLHDEGYRIDKVDAQYFIDRVDRILNPFYRDFELETLLKEDLAELLPLDAYKTWLATVPQTTVNEINEHWGQPEDNFMVTIKNGKHYFIIPRIRNGNMLILRQPPRGDSADKEQGLYHDTTVPMNHYYLAAYFYAREYWNSDAFIHLGTHGTHEYLPGKDRGLSRYDGANLSTGTLPVIYPYIVDDVGEAMQAKRRGNAVTIGHMTPPFAAAGLQGVTADMHTLVDQYRHIDTGGVKQKTKQHIIDFCVKENICKDLHYELAQIDADFDHFLDDLHAYLEELAATNQPLGLHTFGELAEQRLIISTLGQMLGFEFLSAASEFEAGNYEIEDDHHHHGDHEEHSDHSGDHKDEHGHEYKDEHTEEHEHDEHNGDNKQVKSHDDISDGLMHFVKEDLEKTAGYQTLRDYVVNNGDTSDLTDEILPFIQQAQIYYKNIVGIKELDHFVAALSAQYIAPKNGGDPIRNPESLPTGFNLIGFDPSRLPTKAAFEQGTELVEEVIANYYKKHGQYPDKLAFSLWSVEAMRHYGVLESQALYAMGIRPKWSPDGRVVGTEIIPYSELKRPRVDVVLSATGLYRDAFPNVMEMLANAIKELSQLKEASNPIWKNSERVKAELQAEGVDEAEYLSSIRIFSNNFGNYGSGVDEPIMASDTWETDKKIADNYLATMGKHFGTDKSRWGEEVDNLYAKQLSGTDVALFSRSSNLYGMITSDDPFEYFGSLALAVRNIDGKSPEMMISNLRNTNKVKMEMAADMLAKELRTRNFHKRWITEMQKEGYSGAVTMAGNLNNFWGWQVVDPDVVRDDQWDEFVDIYVNDQLEIGLDEWFEEVNPRALAHMMERMLEAERKDYWTTDDERLKSIVEKYIEFVEKYDLIVMNDAVREHANELAKGFGLQTLQQAQTMEDMVAQKIEQQATAKKNAEQQVEGQKLEKQQKQDEQQGEDDHFIWKALAAMFFIMLIGMLCQSKTRQRNAKKQASIVQLSK
ncbi:cobaltochelatase subunit CobN [Algibacillus agarilyticus]|uniref:cobaltochelatase subunit CobN n=1 Tax=Algibacillus agarilyticus TaxID=2234133 RepID=UPI000DCF7F6C|nr:cobaltochelatase subunit CobN [Algibacillus agarilyticus]